MSYFTFKPMRQHLSRAQAHFPPLSSDEALLFVRLLERVTQAVWRAHGHEMAARLHDETDALLPRPRPKRVMCDNNLAARTRMPHKKNDLPF